MHGKTRERISSDLPSDFKLTISNPSFVKELTTNNALMTNNELSNYSIELSVQIGVSTGPPQVCNGLISGSKGQLTMGISKQMGFICCSPRFFSVLCILFFMQTSE